MGPEARCRVETSSSDRLRLELKDGVLRASASGVVGYRAALSAHWMLRREIAVTSASAVVLDLRGCLVMLSPPDYVSLLRHALEKPIAVPVAFVASDWIMSVASAHEAVMGRRGFRRRFFVSAPSALKWLASLRRKPAGDRLL